MYYSSESSDSDNGENKKALDLSYLMLDSDSISSYLRNSVIEQCSTVKSSSISTFDYTFKRVADKDVEDDGREENEMEEPSSVTDGPVLVSQKLTNNQKQDASETDQFPALWASMGRSRSLSEDSDCDVAPRNDHVTEKLFLSHNMMVNVPFEVVFFRNLKFLDLSNNNLTQINEFVLQLPHLQTLYLKNNQLDEFGLPKDFARLEKLREINLSGNLLTRIPPQLLEVISLRYLYLGNNRITEVQPEIRLLENLQVLHLGGNELTRVPDALGSLSNLCALVLCNNKLKKLPRAISNLKNLRSLLLHANNICCLPVEIVKLGSLNELTLRDNPLVTSFVNSCAKEIMHTPPSLKELAARTVTEQRIAFTERDLPATLQSYLQTGQKCVNPKCKGVYFSACVLHIKFVDFCGMYRVPLLHYLCSRRCTSQTPSYYGAQAAGSEDDTPMKRVLLG